MSLLVRSLIRNPLNARQAPRALRRLEDDIWFRDLRPVKRSRRYDPFYDLSPSSLIEQMDNQMAAAVNQINELANDISQMENLLSRYDDDNWVSRKQAVGSCTVKRTESGGIQLTLDVGEFKPDDLKIRVVDDSNLVIEAVRESSGEDSYQKSHFKRWFKLPDECKVDAIKSRLTEDGHLEIDLPPIKPLKEQNARTIPIEMAKKPEATSKESEGSKEGKQS